MYPNKESQKAAFFKTLAKKKQLFGLYFFGTADVKKPMFYAHNELYYEK
jgi:hypothetical protein